MQDIELEQLKKSWDELLRMERARLKLTQQEVADGSGVNIGTVSKVLDGQQSVAYGNVLSVAQYLNVEVRRGL